MAKLTYGQRQDLPKGEFVFPAKRAYPIDTENRARNALARSSGKPEEGKVRSAVYAKYPALKAAHAIHNGLKG